ELGVPFARSILAEVQDQLQFGFAHLENAAPVALDGDRVGGRRGRLAGRMRRALLRAKRRASCRAQNPRENAHGSFQSRPPRKTLSLPAAMAAALVIDVAARPRVGAYAGPKRPQKSKNGTQARAVLNCRAP